MFASIKHQFHGQQVRFIVNTSTRDESVHCKVLSYDAIACNTADLSLVKNCLMSSSTLSDPRATCRRIACLKSSLAPLSPPRVDMRRWL